MSVPAGSEAVDQIAGEGDQRTCQDIGENQIKGRPIRDPAVLQTACCHRSDEKRCAIVVRIAMRDRHRDRIDVACQDRTAQRLGSRQRQNTGAAAKIENPPRRSALQQRIESQEAARTWCRGDRCRTLSRHRSRAKCRRRAGRSRSCEP